MSNIFAGGIDNYIHPVCGVATPYKGDWEEARANAHLIAAAPELLELLKWVVEHSDECLGDHPSRLQAAETIIAKAEGK